MPDIAAARPVAGQPIETAWGQNVHDAIEGMTVQYGRVTMTVDQAAAFHAGSITFPIPFTGDFAFTATPEWHDTGNILNFQSPAPGSISWVLATRGLTPFGASNTQQAFHWIAIGPTV